MKKAMLMMILCCLLSINANAVDLPLFELDNASLEKVKGGAVNIDLGKGVSAKAYPSTMSIESNYAGVLVSFAIDPGNSGLTLGGGFSYKKQDCYKGNGLGVVALGDESKLAPWDRNSPNLFSGIAQYVCQAAWGIDIAKSSSTSNVVLSTAASVPTKTASNAEHIDTLMNKITALNDICRDGSGDDPFTMQACDRRDIKLKELEKLGWCWGHEGQLGREKTWEPCQ